MAEDKKESPNKPAQTAPAPSEADVDQPSAAKEEAQPATATEQQSSRENLLEQARTFLAHDEIRDSTTESKISFLEEKGLTNEEIQQLLGVSRNETSAPEPAVDAAEMPHQQPASEASSKHADPPPIITYPEFLIHASKPPPIVTPTRALKAVYGASLLGTGIYGLSKFVLQPMFESLSEARHDLFTLTKDQLEPLNDKLESVVSSVPPAARSFNIGHERRNKKSGRNDEEDDGDDSSSSEASDPAEMFHRDIAVQTSPPGSSSASAAGDDTTEELSPTNLAASRLTRLREGLDSLLRTSSSALTATEDAKQAVRHVEVYLDQVRYGESGLGGYTGDDTWRSQMFGNKVAGAARNTDAVDSFKVEIRSMKGAMLSARNFPRTAS